MAEATNDADNHSEADTAAATKDGIKNEADTTEATQADRLITESKADIAEATQPHNQKRS